MQVNWTEIVLGLMTLLGSCGWFVAGKKYKQEVEGMKTDNQMKKMDLSSEFAVKFKELIVGPCQVQRVDSGPLGRGGRQVEDRSKRFEGCD